MIQIHDKQFEIYIDSKEVQACVKDVALSLNEAYKGKSPLLIVTSSGTN